MKTTQVKWETRSSDRPMKIDRPEVKEVKNLNIEEDFMHRSTSFFGSFLRSSSLLYFPSISLLFFTGTYRWKPPRWPIPTVHAGKFDETESQH